MLLGKGRRCFVHWMKSFRKAFTRDDDWVSLFAFKHADASSIFFGGVDWIVEGFC